MTYRVSTFRTAGLEARWTRTHAGKPIIVVRNPLALREHQRTQWWAVTAGMWTSMQATGIIEGFTQHTLLGDVFSIPA